MITIKEFLHFIVPDFIRNFIDFYSHKTGIISIYFYISSFFWMYFGLSTLIVLIALTNGNYHKKRTQNVKKIKYAHDIRKIIKHLSHSLTTK